MKFKHILSSIVLVVCLAPSAFANNFESLEVKGGVLPVNVVTQKRCMFGDFDAVFQDYIHSDGKSEVILTASPIGVKPSNSTQVFKPLFSNALKINIKNFIQQDARYDLYKKYLSEKGENIKVSLPKVNKETVLELKVCKNSDLKNRTCEGKLPKDINSILKGYEKSPAEGSVIPDHLYYHQFVKYDGKKITFLKPGLTTEQYGKEAAKFSSGVPLKVHNKFKSIGLRKAKGSLVVDLPVADEAKCG